MREKKIKSEGQTGEITDARYQMADKNKNHKSVIRDLISDIRSSAANKTVPSYE